VDQVQTIEQLHTRYADVLYHKCVRILGDQQEAEDAVQEVFINVFRGLDRFTYGETHLPWLLRITTSVCLNFLRTRRRKGATPMASEYVEQVRSPSNTRRTAQLREGMRQLVGQLDQRSLEIFVAHYVDGMSQGEIAAQMGISRRAVVKRMTALRARAEQIFGGNGHA
jgi:RNA polymerase sigma-70 factor (ECF subfamily)